MRTPAALKWIRSRRCTLFHIECNGVFDSFMFGF